jgi:hypothetical protein
MVGPESRLANALTLAPLDALRGRWRGEFGRKPPAGLSKDMLGRMIAWHIQERAFGGLDLRRTLRPVSKSPGRFSRNRRLEQSGKKNVERGLWLPSPHQSPQLSFDRFGGVFL